MRRKSYCRVLRNLTETLEGRKVKEIYDYNDLVAKKRIITIKFDDGSELSIKGKEVRYTYYAGKRSC